MAKKKQHNQPHWHGSLADRRPVSTETPGRLGEMVGKLTPRDGEAVKSRVVQLGLTWNQEDEA